MQEDDDEAMRICHHCVGDKVLKREIRHDGVAGKCSDCGKVHASWTIEQLAERIRPVFELHHQLTPTHPDEMEDSMLRHGMMNGWDRKGDPAGELLQLFAGLSEETANAVVEALAEGPGYSMFDVDTEDPFGGDALYVTSDFDVSEVGRQWDYLEKQVHHQARFFNNDVRGYLGEMFQGIEAKQTFGATSVIRVIQPGAPRAHVYRARVASKWQEIETILSDLPTQLGAPNGRTARANRMNANGIGVFYGALEPQTCIAEVRAPVGGSVVLGKFEFVQQVRLLDLPALQKVLVTHSPFHPDYKRIAEKCAFLRILAERFSAPVLPNDEAFDYLFPQVVCEFLSEVVGFDGVAFASSQRGGKGTNIALFPKASVLEPLPRGVRTSLTTSHDEDELPTLLIETPPEQVSAPKDEQIWGFEPLPETIPRVIRRATAIPGVDDLVTIQPTLKLNLESVEIVEILGVSYKQQSQSLSTLSLQRSHEEGPPDF